MNNSSTGAPVESQSLRGLVTQAQVLGLSGGRLAVSGRVRCVRQVRHRDIGTSVAANMAYRVKARDIVTCITG